MPRIWGSAFWLSASILIWVGAGCARQAAQRVTPGPETQKIQALRENTLGVAYMNLQRLDDALTAFEDAWATDPTLVAARLNQAIALFNAQRLGEAEQILLELTRAQPENVRAWYNLGLVYRNTGRIEEASLAFERATRLDPEDADSWYLLGLMRAQRSQYAEAVAAYERALEISPFHASAEFGLANVYQRQRRTEEAQEHLARFQRIESENLGAPMGVAYGDQGPYSLAVDATGSMERAANPIDVRFHQADTGIDFRHTRSNSGSIASYLGSGACFLDIDGDGLADLLLQAGSGEPALYRNRGGGRFDSTQDTLPRLPQDGAGCTAGDYDNDGDVDIALSFREAVRLLENDGLGHFSDVSSAAGIAAGGLPLGLTFIDFDHDGDLDLYAARFSDVAWGPTDSFSLPNDLSGPGNVLWRNNGNRTFTDWTAETGLRTVGAGIAASGSDFNNDRAIDFVTTSSSLAPGIFLNPRSGVFQTPDWAQTPSMAAVGVVALDYNKDSWMDLAFTHWGDPALTLWKNLEGKGFSAVELPDLGWQRGWGLVAVDYDDDGWVDLAVAGEDEVAGGVRLLRNTGADGFRDVSEEVGLRDIALENPRALITADYDRDGDPDLFLTQNNGPFVALENDGGNQNSWLRLEFEGLNDNKSAVGTKVEVFAGTHRQKLEIQAGSGYLGQSELYLTAGLASNKDVDTVRMLWPTGVVQDEIELTSRERHQILEIDRRGSSCPVLFAWNGREYEFITDIIGAGVVGHWVGPGQRNISDPTEYVRVPGTSVALKDGQLSFRLVEPMEELVYLDQVRLLTVDHPSNFDVYPNEYFAGEPPFPEFGIIASTNASPPRGAWDTNGADVSDALRLRDGNYVAGFQSTQFRGFAETHTLELDLGNVDTSGPVRLLMNGFVDYFSATSVYAAHQAGVEAILPYLEALDSSGTWTRVMDDFGFPAGLVRTMTRDITGRLPAGTRRIRITTNLKVYWDQIRVDTTPTQPELRITELGPRTAELSWLGYPKSEAGSIGSDVRYVYDDVSPTGPYARHAGYYTPFGDVTDITSRSDDRFAILGSGEQVALEFDPSRLPPLEPGWARDYFFFADGFSKDMDFYEAYSSTVGPLPYHTTEPYPYASGPPQGADFLDYELLRNTRASSGRAGETYRFDFPE